MTSYLFLRSCPRRRCTTYRVSATMPAGVRIGTFSTKVGCIDTPAANTHADVASYRGQLDFKDYCPWYGTHLKVRIPFHCNLHFRHANICIAAVIPSPQQPLSGSAPSTFVEAGFPFTSLIYHTSARVLLLHVLKLASAEYTIRL
jgi:hypothetical protein